MAMKKVIEPLLGVWLTGFLAAIWLTFRDESNLSESTIVLLWAVLGGIAILAIAGWAWSRMVVVEAYTHPRRWLRGGLLTLGLLTTCGAVYYHYTRMRGLENQGMCAICGRLTGTGVSYGGGGYAFHYYCPEHIHQAPEKITIRGRVGGDLLIGWGWLLGVTVPLFYLTCAMSNKERDTRRSIRGYAVAASCGAVYALLVTVFPPYGWLAIFLALAFTRFTFSRANP